MFKVKLIVPIVVILSFYSAVNSNAQTGNTSASVISAEKLANIKDPVIKTFMLYQNEKTHFANVTKVKFDLYIDADVILNVLDDQGNIIEKLIDGSLQPGHYNVYYKSSDEKIHAELSYMIKVNGVSESKSILIFK